MWVQSFPQHCLSVTFQLAKHQIAANPKPGLSTLLDGDRYEVNEIPFFLALKMHRSSGEMRRAQKDARQTEVNPEQRSKAQGAFIDGMSLPFQL